MSQENVEIVRCLWEAAERRDSEAVFALYDPDIVWSSAGSHGALEVGGSYHGHDGVQQFFRQWLESFETYEAHAEMLPATLEEALAALGDDACLAEGFGKGFIDYYLRIKEAELARYHAEVTEWEQREYFDFF